MTLLTLLTMTLHKVVPHDCRNLCCLLEVIVLECGSSIDGNLQRTQWEVAVSHHHNVCSFHNQQSHRSKNVCSKVPLRFALFGAGFAFSGFRMCTFGVSGACTLRWVVHFGVWECCFGVEGSGFAPSGFGVSVGCALHFQVQVTVRAWGLHFQGLGILGSWARCDFATGSRMCDVGWPDVLVRM